MYYYLLAGKESIAGSEIHPELDSQWCADSLLFLESIIITQFIYKE